MPAIHTKKLSQRGLHNMIKLKFKNIMLAIGLCTSALTPFCLYAATIGAMPSETPTSPVDITISDPIMNEDINKKTSDPLDTKTPEYVILQPIDEATFSSETSASVSKLYVKEGSYFRAGDTLLELDCRVQKAEYEKAIAQQVATNIALKSAMKLKSYGSISEYEVVKAQSEAAMVNADVNKLSAIVEKCVIKAPFNGAVAELQVHTHESVKPGDPLIKIVNTDHLIVELEVPSTWLQWLHINTNFLVHVNELNKSIDAKIVRINPKIEPVSQTVKIVGEISVSPVKLLPGMSGQAIFPENPSKQTAAAPVLVPAPGRK